RSQCQNNLKQIAIGMHHCHDVNKHLPSGGWGWFWVGEPGRGSGKDQPGGWGFAVLPYVEQQSLYNLGNGLTGAAAVAAGHQRSSPPLPLFACPTRRLAQQLPLPFERTFNGQAFDGIAYYNWPGEPLLISGRTDYASCGGNQMDSAQLNDGPDPRRGE